MFSTRNRLILLVLTLAASGLAVGDTCNSPISDPSGFLGNSSAVAASTNKVVDQGADPHVVTFSSLSQYGGNLDAAEHAIERDCTSWQSASGGRKSNLIVFALAPNDHRAAIYFGGAWSGALGNGRWTHIASDFMSPRFKSKDWAGGISAGEDQVAARLVAFKDEAAHPAVSTTTVNNQAQDLSGFWKILGWLLFFLGLGAIVYFVYRYLAGSQARKQETLAAQQEAQEAKVAVASSLNTIRDSLGELEANKDPRYEDFNAEYSVIAANFTRIDQSSRLDPSQDGLSKDQYEIITRQFNYLNNSLGGLRQRIAGKTSSPFSSTTVGTRATQSYPYTPAASASASHSPKPHHRTTVYEDNSVTVVNTPSYREPEPEPAPRHESHASSSRSSSEDSDHGSSFSWGSDSSSSSSSDTGSSFSFGSDSGGGSGSDGGGSVDF